ncbi:MAG: hypothetical protein ACNS60_02745 [Candidatus Cyclobacteriaceae bacterium M2_1C_046]
MPHPLANIAISLAPVAADLFGKVVNIKKEAGEKKDISTRVEQLENYEVEQAKLLEELTLKVDYLQQRNRTLSWMAGIAIWLGIFSFIGIIVLIFTL